MNHIQYEMYDFAVEVSNIPANFMKELPATILFRLAHTDQEFTLILGRMKTGMCLVTVLFLIYMLFSGAIYHYYNPD